MPEEDDGALDSWSQARAPHFPQRARKRRALDSAISSASSAPDLTISQEIWATCPAVSRNSNLSRTRGCSGAKSSRRGQWWSTELDAPVEIGVDFVPDAQDGGGDEFIFFPKSGGCVRDAHDAARARVRARQQMERMRQLFSPLQSLTNQLRHGVSKNEKPSTSPMPLHPSPNMEDDLTNDELLLDDESEPMTYHEPESPSSDTWSSSRFKSRRLPPVPSIAPATSPSPTVTRAPYGPSTAGMFKSRRSPPSAMHGPPPPSPSATSMGPSSKSPG